MSARSYLRSITRSAHGRVDTRFSAFDLSDDHSYRGFLEAQATAFLPLEAALDRAGAGRLLSDWPQRRRADALKSDLTELGIQLPNEASAPDYLDEASIWGGLYVLEGSRLGGAVLRRSVGRHLPKAFLKPAPKGAWSAFVAELERNLYDRVILQRAGVSALNTFACFENL